MTEHVTENGHIGVLLGGCSSEREISLKSGRAVAAALERAGGRVSLIDITSERDEDVAAQVRSAGIEAAFIALHGGYGEDGRVQTVLEGLDIPYTGSGPQASRDAMSKVCSHRIMAGQGIAVPDYVSCDSGAESPPDLDFVIDRLRDFPLVVKPDNGGSSIGIRFVHNREDLFSAVREACGYGAGAVIERAVKGPEITAGIFDGEVLPLIEIRPQGGFFDYQAKYEKGRTQYLVPAPVSGETAREIRETALKAFQALGCRDFARLDFLCDKEGRPFFLEANTVPGFTETSLLPMAARSRGIAFEDLCCRLVALARGRKKERVV